MFRPTRPLLQRIVRISERYVEQGYELKVKDIMSGVQRQVLSQPGLLSIETLVDQEDPNKLLVLTEWESKKEMQNWLKSDLCKEVSSR
eukprot:g4363.t1